MGTSKIDMQNTLPVGQPRPLKRSSVKAKIDVTVARHSQTTILEVKPKLARAKQIFHAVLVDDPHITRYMVVVRQAAVSVEPEKHEEQEEHEHPKVLEEELAHNPGEGICAWLGHHAEEGALLPLHPYFQKLEFSWLTGTTNKKVSKIGGCCTDYYISKGVEADHFRNLLGFSGEAQEII
uniref:Uncharacterized protein n=1 Tax=Cannabis sativa TaxID=3483 RepID=A0A803NT38_CANSA